MLTVVAMETCCFKCGRRVLQTQGLGTLSMSDLSKSYKGCLPYSITFFLSHLHLGGVWLIVDVRKDTNRIVPKINIMLKIIKINCMLKTS